MVQYHKSISRRNLCRLADIFVVVLQIFGQGKEWLGQPVRGPHQPSLQLSKPAIDSSPPKVKAVEESIAKQTRKDMNANIAKKRASSKEVVPPVRAGNQ